MNTDELDDDSWTLALLLLFIPGHLGAWAFGISRGIVAGFEQMGFRMIWPT